MRVLVACEFSGVVRDAFKLRGHDAWSCDILDTEATGNHLKGDVLGFLDMGWDMMIAHPPCTYLTCAGNKWMKPEYSHRFPDRPQQRERAVEFFMALMNANIPRIAVENPVGIMSTRYRKPDQIIQPYQFGHPDRKSTCLWLKNLPKLILDPSKLVEPVLHTTKSGRTMSKHHAYAVSMEPHERMKFRSKTYRGIADAMAEQWG